MRRNALSPSRTPPTGLSVIARELLALEAHLVEVEQTEAGAIASVTLAHRESARNLIHYLALRQRDLRELQPQLAELGLSSLGRAERCVLRNVLEVSIRAHESLALGGSEAAKRELPRLAVRCGDALTWADARARQRRNTLAALGDPPAGRQVAIMVTAPGAAEADPAWMKRMLLAGMNVLRVNCAHDDEAGWERMVCALEQARLETGRPCRVLMDLAGPKIRTGAVAARRVGTWRPEKDELGRVTAQARVVIRRAGAKAAPADLRVADVALSRLRVGDALRFEDARGKARTLAVAAVSADEAVAWADKRGYVLDQASAQVRRGGRLVGTLVLEVCGEGDGAIDVQVGDALVLTRRQVEGRSPKRTKDGHVKVPGRIACTLPAALDRVAVGHRVLFDDGKIQAVVEQVHARRGELDLRVVRTSKARASLRAEKGINLPDTVTTVPSLTEDDLAALRFVARRADAVILSFVRRPSDVTALHAVLDRLGRPDLGVVLKIETRAGFEHLPRLLLAGLRRPTLAVMIARGDLAVEAGFERLAELQEEILWLCEASHVPVIWATQVLDTLARTGVPSRAEVTDAAASVAAECVMLNKGPFVDEAVKVLADILQRMETHHDKKRSLFRRLEVSSLSLE